MEFLSAILGPVAESLLVPVKKHLGYLFSSTKHVGNMSTRMEQLLATGADVKRHMERNDISNLEIPTRVPVWLKAVEKIEEDSKRIISGNVDNGCFNLKMRYRTGRKAFKTSEQIQGLINENIDKSWSDAPTPLGKVVSSKNASTSAPSDGDDAHNFFKSRDKIFKEALGFLKQDHKAQLVALCGMGGVGKTTMMEQLKKAIEDKKMFDWVVKVVIGEKMNTFSIQQAVAEYLQIPLTETSTTARADRLRVTFGKISQERKEKVLVILDDVWEKVELKDIGLCPLPNSSKLLLTSRNESICTQIAIEDDLDLRVVRVDVMEELEANNFFFHISKVSDPDLKETGVKIVKRCGFLPLAIKLIATNLKSKEKSVWRNTLHRLKKNELDKNVQKIVEISYNFLAEEDAKAVFLLCGLFPDDFDIPIEDLTRYAWGLKLLNEVPTLGDARDRTKTCVLDLKNANLLLSSDQFGCVKMHDLVLAFVVAKVSKANHPWIINHSDVSYRSRPEMSKSCKSISLTCMGMSEFPRDFNYPNVSLLRLMNGNESLKFPDDFYEKMENLQVLAFEKLHHPLLPTSLQCSTTLRTLCLHKCSLMSDCSSIGDYLLNLEVLSFAHSGIRYLPSAIGNLVKLKLLDLTDCIDLRVDEGVLKNLVKLEELYMKVKGRRGVRFTDINYEELAERSKNHSALDFEFLENNPHSKNMSYNKLERFSISMGRFLKYAFGMRESDNRLMLKVANKDELLESGLNELFSKTEVLYLEAGSGMNNLEEVLPKSVPQHSLFYNLRVLCVYGCADLRYLFTVPVARGLVKLERLTIKKCPVMEALVYSEENGEEEKGVEDIRFQELKDLWLQDLPKLGGLSNTNNIVIHLPQLLELDLVGLPNFTSIYPPGEYKSATSIMSSGSSTIKPFFNKEAMIPPRLETLRISDMEALKNIWPPCEQVVDAATCSLREISVSGCDNLVNMFPRNPMPLLHHLEKIFVHHCGSIQVLFDIDVGCIGEIKEGCGSKLRSITVYDSGKLTEVWRLKRGGAAVHINHPNDDDVIICGCFQAVEVIEIQWCPSFRNIFTPITARFDLGALKKICIDGEGSVKESDESVRRNQDEIYDTSKGKIIQAVDNIPYVAYPFHLLPTFHHLQSLLLRNLTDVEAVFEIENATSRDLATLENQQPPILSHLKQLKLSYLEKMNCVWKCTSWNHFLYSQKQGESSFQNLTTIFLERCGKIKYLFSPLMAKLLFNLKTIAISDCDGIEEVVSNRDDDGIQTMAAASTSSSTNPTFFPHLDGLSLYRLSKLKLIHDGGARGNASEITSNVISNISVHENFKSSEVDGVSWSLCQYPRKIKISECNALSIVIPFNAVGKLQKLQKLKITECWSMRKIFEIEGGSNNGCHGTDVDDESGDIVTTPRLVNMIVLELPKLTILRINQCDLLEHVFTSSTLESLKQLKELTVEGCKAMQVIVKEDDQKENVEHTRDQYSGVHILAEEVFEVAEETNDYMNETQSVVVFPKLKEVTLKRLESVKHIWKSNRGIVLNFPNLTKVFINGCALLENVFTSCMVSSLSQLHELHISKCKNMEVIVKQVEEDSDTRANEVVVFPCLKCITLLSLENLKGFYLGLEAFKWPSLDTLEIKDCPQIKVFTSGQSTTPELKVIDTTFGLCYATEDPTSFIKTKQQEGWQF